jgi:hypothetical protein
MCEHFGKIAWVSSELGCVSGEPGEARVSDPCGAGRHHPQDIRQLPAQGTDTSSLPALKLCFRRRTCDKKNSLLKKPAGKVLQL